MRKVRTGVFIFWALATLLFSVLCPNQGSAQDPPLLQLGRKLFFEKALSFNNTKSCASCHDPSLAFTDGYRRSLGATADLHMRNSPTLINVSDYLYFTAADPRIVSLEQQIRGPLFNTAPLELGATGHESEILTRIKSNREYQLILSQLGSPDIGWPLVITALAEYLRALRRYDSKYDRYLKEGEGILSPSELRGLKLFFSSELKCSECHGGPNLNTPKTGDYFVANGFFKITDTHIMTKFPPDTGLALITSKAADVGKFRIPTLRNVAITAPYMHDGSVQSLAEVIDTYSKGGLNQENKSPIVRGFSATPEQKIDLLDFLRTLSSQ